MYILETGLLTQISSIGNIINFAIMIVAIIGMGLTMNSNYRKQWKSKADVDIVECMSRDIKEKADIKFVEDQITNVKEKITESNETHMKMIEKMSNQVEFLYKNEIGKNQK